MKEGWEMKKLGEMSQIMYGHTAKTSTEVEGVKYLRITDIQNGLVDWDSVPTCPNLEKYEKYELKYGDIVFARTGATTGKSYLIKNPPKAVFASYLIRVQTDQEEILPEFLSMFFQSASYWNVIEAGISGSAQGGFNAKKLGGLSIPIPTLTEQKQIVTLLDTAFAKIDQAKANIEKNIANAKELFQSKLNEFFSQKGDGWEEKMLSKVVTEECSLSYGIVQPGKDIPDGLPVVRPTDMKNKFVNFEGLKLIEPERAKSYARTKLNGNELLLCVRGETGGTSLTTKELEGANVTRGIVPITFNDNLIRLEFGFYQFNSKNLQNQIKEKTYGATLKQINIRDVRKLILYIPPIEIQNKLIRKITTLEINTTTLILNFRLKLQNLEELKKSLLQKAFAGELTKAAVSS